MYICPDRSSYLIHCNRAQPNLSYHILLVPAIALKRLAVGCWSNYMAAGAYSGGGKGGAPPLGKYSPSSKFELKEGEGVMGKKLPKM